jgi:hypothetical protein
LLAVLTHSGNRRKHQQQIPQTAVVVLGTLAPAADAATLRNQNARVSGSSRGNNHRRMMVASCRWQCWELQAHKQLQSRAAEHPSH